MPIEIVTVGEKTKDALQKQAGKTVGVPKTVTVAVDEYVVEKGKHDALAKKLKALKTKVDTTAGVLRDYVGSVAEAEEPVVVKGEKHAVEVGACPNEVSSVDVDKVIEILGVDVFLKIAKVGITDLRRYLTPEQFAEACTEAHTGTRRIKVLD